MKTFWSVVSFATASALGVSPLAAQNTATRLEGRACDFLLPAPYLRDVRECKWLIVPENRARPNGRTFRLAVVVYRAQEPDGSPPLLLLHGGPGGAGGASMRWTQMGYPLARRRDVITLDYRGVAGSEPAICPDFENQAAPAFYLPTRKEWEEGFRTAVRQCVASLDAQGLDRSAFGAYVFAADVIDLRRALGYAQWDVYGVSYGTLVAQELMRQDARGIHAAVLASGSAPGPHYAARFLGADYQRLLQQVFVACASQPACHSAFPTVEADFYALHDEFSKTPVQVATAGAAPARSVLLTGDRFLLHMHGQLGLQRISRLPLLINELRRGNRDAALARLVADGGISPWDPLGHLVWCNEYGKTYRAMVASYKQSVKSAFHTISDDFREHCDLWLSDPPRQSSEQSIASAIPTLVLHGEFDAMDPAFMQARMMAKLDHAYAFTFPGETHGNPPVGCHGSIVQQFLEDPARPPDASCLEKMPRIRFATSFESTLKIAIEVKGGDPNSFTGEWEAPFAGGRDWEINLAVSGDTVTGGVTFPAAAPIYDAKVEGSTLRFKVKAPNGRVVTFTATRTGAELNLTRDVEVPAGAPPGGAGLFGTLGPKALTARRVR